MTNVSFRVRAVLAVALLCILDVAVRQLVADNIPQTEHTPAAQNPGVQPKFLLQTQSAIVVLDVAVTDANGNPVHGLKAADFTLREDGRTMTLRSFEDHGADAASKAAPRTVTLGVNSFSNVTATPANNGPLYVMVFDALNLNWNNQSYARGQMLQYIKKIPAGAQVAVFIMGEKLELLQGFTSDPTLLNAAVTNVTTYTGTSTGPEHSRTALSYLARYLGTLPGRKNLLWFSGGIPLIIQPPGCEPVGVIDSLVDELHATDDELIRAHVALYPVDSRGITMNSCADAYWQHQGMEMMADATGGKAFYTTNDLVAAAAEAVKDGADYYTLAYQPTNPELDGSYRKLKVAVDKPHLQLAYRDGYYADDTKAIQHLGEKAEKNPSQKPAPYVPTTPMQIAMQRGAPTPTEILFTVNLDPSGATDETLPATNKANAKLMKPPYRHFTINYSGDIKGFSDTLTPDGVHHIVLEADAMLYTTEGRAINAATNAMRLDITDANYQALLKSGLHLHQQIDAPVKGEYLLRVGIHDLSSNHIGAVEIPLADIKPQSASTK